MTDEVLSIKSFFSCRSVFITGATGFIGKVLIEKLLRSFPDIEKVYVLIRPKKGKSIEQRVLTITNSILFDKLRSLQPNAIKKKLRPIEGDVSELGLGLSEGDRKELIENVSIIIHGAASVRFDDPFRSAVLLNTRGAREVVQLALETKNLVAFMHISTTYCHLDKLVVGEHAYPPLADWRKTIEICENMDTYTLDILANKYMKNMPNTYTFSKSLAERVVYDMCKGKIPAVILRPSIVISIMYEPVPGWIDNFNGPVALLVASGKGILRTSYADPSSRADYVPVDLIAKILIGAIWQKGITRDIEEKLDVTFYNASNNNMHSITLGEMLEFGKQLVWEAPLNNVLWFPGGGVTLSRTYNYVRTIVYQVLPAIVVDKIFTLLDKKPILLKIQRRIYTANMALQLFLLNQWSFMNDNTLGLVDKILPEEQEELGFDPSSIDVFGYFKNCLVCGRKYLLNEDDSTIESARSHLYRMYILDRIAKFLICMLVVYVLVYKICIVEHVSRIGSKVSDALFTWE